jgi:hypothetical protein
MYRLSESARAERADGSLVYSYDHLGTVSGLIWDMLDDCRCNYIFVVKGGSARGKCTLLLKCWMTPPVWGSFIDNEP